MNSFEEEKKETRAEMTVDLLKKWGKTDQEIINELKQEIGLSEEEAKKCLAFSNVQKEAAIKIATSILKRKDLDKETCRAIVAGIIRDYNATEEEVFQQLLMSILSKSTTSNESELRDTFIKWMKTSYKTAPDVLKFHLPYYHKYISGFLEGSNQELDNVKKSVTQKKPEEIEKEIAAKIERNKRIKRIIEEELR